MNVSKKEFYGWIWLICLYMYITVTRLPDRGWQDDLLFLATCGMSIAASFMAIKHMKPK